ncbi:MAG: hypothetical protein V3R44_04740 [bacterium]
MGLFQQEIRLSISKIVMRDAWNEIKPLTQGAAERAIQPSPQGAAGNPQVKKLFLVNNKKEELFLIAIVIEVQTS